MAPSDAVSAVRSGRAPPSPPIGFDTLTVLSLVLAVGVGVLWLIGTYRIQKVSVSWIQDGGDLQRYIVLHAQCANGQMTAERIEYLESDLDDSPGLKIWSEGVKDVSFMWPKSSRPEWHGFAVNYAEPTGMYPQRSVGLKTPLWFLLSVCLMLPALRAVAVVRSRMRARLGQCPHLQLRPPRHARPVPGVRGGRDESPVVL